MPRATFDKLDGPGADGTEDLARMLDSIFAMVDPDWMGLDDGAKALTDSSEDKRKRLAMTATALGRRGRSDTRYETGMPAAAGCGG